MLSRKEALRWQADYDSRTYPPEVYEELVVDQREYPNRLAILGAWKWASLRADPNGTAYADTRGDKYRFTARWKPGSPVGHPSWLYLSETETELRLRIPERFPRDRPDIVDELQAMDRIGFVLAVFVLHCSHPEVYPLYDQHVYRAYRYLDTSGREITGSAPGVWVEYARYRDFFQAQVREVGLPYWQVDRALWAMGRHLKQQRIVSRRPIPQRTAPSPAREAAVKSETAQLDVQEWVHSKTFGGKQKSFWWRVDDDSIIYIRRVFKGNKQRTDRISAEELGQLNRWVSDSNWVPLANNIEKLRLGTEQEGVGWFLCNVLRWQSSAEWQLSSQLGVIFTLSGVWEYNGRRRGICFRKTSEEWRDLVSGCCQKHEGVSSCQ
jgi:hypothetical protein